MTRLLRRWGPWAALLLALAVVLGVGASRADNHQSRQQQTLSIAGRVRCPVCQGESAAQSDTPAAQDIRQQISTDLSRGESSGQIVRSLEASYGASILESPPTSGLALWAWVTPVVVVAVAAVGLVLGFRHWRRPNRALAVSGLTVQTRGGRGASASSAGSPVGSGDPLPAAVSAEDQALVRAALAERAQAQRAQAGRER